MFFTNDDARTDYVDELEGIFIAHNVTGDVWEDENEDEGKEDED